MTQQAAISLVELPWALPTPRILVVWNRRYFGWSLPGGLVEEGETSEAAQERELFEETGCRTTAATKIYEAPAEHLADAPVGRATTVCIYRVQVQATEKAKECEPGCPVSWFTREEFLKSTPFKAFYAEFFRLFPETPSPTRGP